MWAPGVVSTLADHSVLLALVILPECHLAFGFFQQGSSMRIDGSLEAPRNSDDLKITDYLPEKTRMPKDAATPFLSLHLPANVARREEHHRNTVPDNQLM